MDRTKLKKVFSNFYLERINLEEAADQVLELFNVVELKQECPVGADVVPEKKNTLPDDWCLWCRAGDEHTFDETVIGYLNNKYNTDSWKAYPDRYYGEHYFNGEYSIAVSNIPFGRKLTFDEFQLMVIQEAESTELKPNELIKVSKSTNTYPYSITYILKP